MIDFQSIKISSPVIDFGRIVLTNLPDTHNILDIQDFIRMMMQTYIYELKKVFPQVNCKNVYKEITNHILFPYVNMSPSEFHAIRNHVSLLHALDMLSCFS